MGKKTGKIPVKESIVPKAMDRMPGKSIGDKWAQNLSEKQMYKYAQKDMANMMAVTQRVMQKSILRDSDGNELENPHNMQDGVPYVISSSSTGKNIGWVMRKGMAGVGRVYNEHIDSYEAIANDPDRPYLLESVEFEGIDLDEYGLTDADFGINESVDRGEDLPFDIDDESTDDSDYDFGE